MEVARACGHLEDFRTPKLPGEQYLRVKLERFTAKKCADCRAADEPARLAKEKEDNARREADPVLVAQKKAAVEQRMAAKRLAAVVAKREEVYGSVPEELRDVVLSYGRIANLMHSEASALAANYLLPAEEMANMSVKQITKMSRDWHGVRVIFEKLAASYSVKMGFDIDHGDYFASISRNGRWLGVRGGSLPLVVCKLGLMVHFQAWPPGS